MDNIWDFECRNECNLIYIKSVKILFKKKNLKGLILCGKYFVYILGFFFIWFSNYKIVEKFNL